MRDAAGAIRPAWQGLADALEAMGPETLARRTEEVKEQLRFNGVTYHVYGGPRGADRQWALDPVPAVIDSATWSGLERGLIQRAELLEAILRDIYGPRLLMKEGLLPPLLLYSHPGFQRACIGSLDPASRLLQVYSADLARGRDGEFRVVSDRCQNPSGYGYALENRVVLGRALPSLFRTLGVHRLAPFFQALRRGLKQAAPPGTENPNTVLLSPGPENETFFEQAYLASYLGIPLVRGGDLSARADGIWLDGLGGSRRVDVVLRRVDDAWCDPLELEGASLIGVPGMLQAVRRRRVAVANALGSGVLTGSGLMAFLPALCRRVLGQDLRLPSSRTWWCGDEAMREEAMSRFDSMVVKPLYQGPKRSTWFVSDLGREQRERLLARIRAKPHLYVIQERADLSTLPCFVQGRLEPRPMVVRAFLAAADKTFEVMPGGLTRASVRADSAALTGQEGGISKDTWIIASEPIESERPIELAPPASRSERETSTLPGYAAENLFWLGRYQERLEAQARLWREAIGRVSQEGGTDGSLPAGELRLLRACQPGLLSDGSGWESQLIRSLTQREDLGSPAFNLASLRRAARVVRELLSRDAWHSLHAWEEGGPEADAGDEGIGPLPDAGSALLHLDRLVVGLAGFTGMVTEGMTLGPVQRFLQMGRRLERAQAICRSLLAAFPPGAAADRGLLQALLATHDSDIAYHNKYGVDLLPSAVADVLLRDEGNPRSAAAPLARLLEDLAALPRPVPGRSTETEKHALLALAALRVYDPAAQEGILSPGGNEAFEHVVKHVEASLGEVSNRLAAEYFRQRPLTQTLKEWA